MDVNGLLRLTELGANMTPQKRLEQLAAAEGNHCDKGYRSRPRYSGEHMKTVIEMAREAGFTLIKAEWVFVDMLERFAELVHADEREACAALCDRFANRMMSAEECADAIRARSNK